jgi:outer membrane receptor for ferrienterochelin and colicin
MKYRLGRLALAVVTTGTLLAATAEARVGEETEARDIRGEVRDSVSGSLLEGVEVRLEDSLVLTDVSGRFSIRRGAAPYRFKLKAPGGKEVVRTVSEVESLSDVTFLLDPPVTREESVDVFGVHKDDPAPASIPLRPQEVLQVAGAVDNIFRALQTLPGVAATDEFGSRLAVRGGTPDQNLTIMDGVEIHNPYRLFGLTSAFNPETVEKFDLSAGAFSAKYGDRLSSILIVENRDGTRTRGFGGSTTLSITDGNVLFEGPWKNRDKGSWIVSARRTYYDLIAERITHDNLPGFNDLQFRATYESSPSTSLTLFGIRSRESGDARFEGDGPDYGDLVTAATNDVYGLRARRFFGSKLQSTLAAAYYDFSQTLSVDASFEDGSQRSNARINTTRINVDFDQTTATRDLSLRNDWSLALPARNLLEAGFEFHHLTTGATYNIRGDRNLSEANPSSIRGGAALPDLYDENIPSSRFGIYAQDRVSLGPRVSVEAGLRLSRSTITRTAELEPRVSLLLKAGDTSRFRAAYGSHSQSPGIEKLLQSDYFIDLSALGLRDERSKHATLGFEKDFPSISLKTEAYYKTFSDLIVGALETDQEQAARLARYDFPPSLQWSIPTEKLITTTPSNAASGRSYGVEFVATRPLRSADQFLSGWASYSLGKATKDAYGRSLPFEYDRRHALSVVTQLNASEKVQVGLTLRASSGFPRTKPIDVRVVPVEDALDADKDGNVTELVPKRDAQGLPVYTADYGSVENLLLARFPAFVRLDMRFNWKPRGAKGRWLFYLEFINATNRENVSRYEASLRPLTTGSRPIIQETPSGGLPFLPTFGIRFRF